MKALTPEVRVGLALLTTGAAVAGATELAYAAPTKAIETRTQVVGNVPSALGGFALSSDFTETAAPKYPKRTKVCISNYPNPDGSLKSDGTPKKLPALLYKRPNDTTQAIKWREAPKTYTARLISRSKSVIEGTYIVPIGSGRFVRPRSANAPDFTGVQFNACPNPRGPVTSPGDTIDGDGEVIDANNDGFVSSQTPDGSTLTVSCLDDAGTQELRAVFSPSRSMGARISLLVTGPGDTPLIPGQASVDQFMPISTRTILSPVVYNGTEGARLQATLDLGNGMYPRMKVDVRSVCDGDESGAAPGGDSEGGIPPEEEM